MMSVKSKQKNNSKQFYMEKKRNLWVIPTDKPSRLHYNELDELVFTSKSEQLDGVNIYITSNETAYPYALHLKNQELLKINGVGENSGELYHDKGFSYPDDCKKIILTTDQDFIKDGVQAIDDEFLEWFIKNPSCEKVAVNGISDVALGGFTDVCYKIIIPRTTQQIINEYYAGGLEMGQIIPKEEPKQDLEKEMFELEQELDIPSHLRWHNSKPKQETLEKAIRKEYKFRIGSHSFSNPINIGGQQQSYTEEDMKIAFYANIKDWILFEEFIEQFKNK